MGIFRTKKYMTLNDVRVYYDEKTNRIRLTSSDSRIRGGLNILFNPGRKNEIEVRNALIAEGVIPAGEFQSPLPNRAVFPSGLEDKPFDIPLGAGTKGTIFWSVNEDTYSHLLVVGVPGTGKTVLSSNIISHCHKHDDVWEIAVVGLQDQFREEIRLIEDKVGVRSSSMADALELLRSIVSEASSRTASNVKRKLVVVEDYGHLLYASEDENSEGRIAMEIIETVSTLLRIGRSVGIHVLIDSHVHENLLTSSTGIHLPAILALGRLTKRESVEMFRSDLSSHTTGEIMGRGIIHTKNGVEHIQIFGPVSS
jgi:KaiC/GvpD/RAD55 family RecA-like ATPase